MLEALTYVCAKVDPGNQCLGVSSPGATTTTTVAGSVHHHSPFALGSFVHAVPWHPLVHMALYLCLIFLPLAVLFVVSVLIRLRRGPASTRFRR